MRPATGGWYSGLKPANLRDANGKRVTSTDMESNHIPAKASYAHLDEPGFRTGGVSRGSSGPGRTRRWSP